MVRRINHGAERYKEREKKDEERAVADEICPPSKKTYEKSSSPFYHLDISLFRKKYSVKSVNNRSGQAGGRPEKLGLSHRPLEKGHREY
jgi:hypothetical protein